VVVVILYGDEKFEKELIEYQASRPTWDGVKMVYPKEVKE